MRYLMFSKHLQTLAIPEAGRAIRELGFDGVELTVRPGGHVGVENVEADLPRAVEQLGEVGLSVPAIVVEIHNRRQPYAEAVCRAARAVGARELRTSSQRYKPFGSIREQIAAAKADAKELEALGREHDLRLCVHTHSGNYLSAQGATLATILDETDPRYVGVSFDLAHLTAEGSNAGWMQSLDLLHDRIGIVAVKSYAFFGAPDAETGGTRWTSKLVPLDQGSARWRDAFHLLRQVGWDADGQALVSVHSEYQGGASWRELDVPELIEQTRADLVWLRRQADEQSASRAKATQSAG